MGVVASFTQAKAKAWLQSSLAPVHGPDFKERAKRALEQEVAFYKQMQRDSKS